MDNIINDLDAEIINKNFKNRIPILQQQIYDEINKFEYKKNTPHLLKNLIILFLNEKINSCYGEETKNNILQLYIPLFQHSKHNKNNFNMLWSPQTIFLLDQYETTRELLKQNNFDYEKGVPRNVREYAIRVCFSKIHLNSHKEQSIIKYEEQYKQHMTNFNRYKGSSEIDWKKILTDFPSLNILRMAYKENYSIKPIDLQKVFLHTYNNMEFKEELIEHKAEIFVEIFLNSTFFKNTIAPSKKINISIAKSLNYKIKTDNYYNGDIFANCIVNHPVFKHQNLKKRIENQTYLKHFGTTKPTENQIKDISEKRAIKKNKI